MPQTRRVVTLTAKEREDISTRVNRYALQGIGNRDATMEDILSYIEDLMYKAYNLDQ